MFDSTTCYYGHGGTGPFDLTIPFSQLEPGIYYFEGSVEFGGTSGSAEASVQVTCCSETARDRDSSNGEGSGEAGLVLMITIGDDGTCSFKHLPSAIEPPCP
ncbi:MAG: hypothetical protein WB783_00955 [Arenicellales bacterium]